MRTGAKHGGIVGQPGVNVCRVSGAGTARALAEQWSFALQSSCSPAAAATSLFRAAACVRCSAEGVRRMVRDHSCFLRWLRVDNSPSWPRSSTNIISATENLWKLAETAGCLWKPVQVGFGNVWAEAPLASSTTNYGDRNRALACSSLTLFSCHAE